MITQSPNLTAMITTKLQSLSPEQQSEVLQFIESLIQPTQPPKSIWEKIQALAAEIPEAEWATLPSNGSVQHDHYHSSERYDSDLTLKLLNPLAPFPFGS